MYIIVIVYCKDNVSYLSCRLGIINNFNKIKESTSVFKLSAYQKAIEICSVNFFVFFSKNNKKKNIILNNIKQNLSI